MDYNIGIGIIVSNLLLEAKHNSHNIKNNSLPIQILHTYIIN